MAHGCPQPSQQASRCWGLPGEQAGCVGPVLTPSCLGCAFQVAQTARALHWIVKTLRDGGLGSGEDAPTLGEWWLHFESGLCGEQREADIGGCCWAWRKAAMHVPSAAEAPAPDLT